MEWYIGGCYGVRRPIHHSRTAMPYAAKVIANTFLDRTAAAGVVVIPMKLQRLVYFAHGWHLAIQDEPLLDEPIEAWSFGPVIRSLYVQLALYGNGAVTAKLPDLNVVEKANGGYRVSSFTPEVGVDNPSALFVRDLVARVWDVYGSHTAIELSNMAHAAGTPWDVVARRHGGRPPRRTTIPNDLIRECFVEYAGV